MPVSVRATRPLGLAALAACLVLGQATAARADDGGGWTDGTTIGTGTTSTVPGSPGNNAGGSTTREVPNPCLYKFWLPGPAMAAYAGTWFAPLIGVPPNWQDHATDLTGAWYQPTCTYGPGMGTPDEFDAYAAAFYASHVTAWFVDPPPPPPIPVPDLIRYAKDSTGIPTPLVTLNPTGETVVGLRTWVWPTGGLPAPIVSRAESGPNWAQVVATPSTLHLSVADGTVGSCDRAPAYTSGAPDSATDCYVEFTTSSARTGTSTIHVTINWKIVLTTSDGRDQVLQGGFPRESVVPIAVAEVQSVLR